MLALVVVVAVLYLAREVLIPLALAILFSFVLAPGVRLLERARLGRVASTFITVIAGCAILGAVGWVAANQGVSLAAKLPEYRNNINEKIRALRSPSKGDLGKAAKALKEIEKQAAPERPPLAVKETPASPYEALVAFAAPFAKPLATALAVIVFTILMLLNRETMRERLIGLIGAGRINLTTQALNEVGFRVSRYLYMQLVVNALFGIPFGIALYFIGIPNALLWGLLAVLLRFIPYAGVWIAVAMPAVLAFAISKDWSMVAWTLGVFLALELVLVNLVEPLLYGKSAGLAPMAIIVAALFWTWLWGPIGLLMATPLTVCVAVMGRYIPELSFLNMLLGVEPVLTPAARLYQRLVAFDQEEATELVETGVKEEGVTQFYGATLIPALRLIERDRHAGAIEPDCERSIFDNLRLIVEELPGEPAQRIPCCIVAAHDEADQIAAIALAAESGARLIPFPLLANEVMQEIENGACNAVCISAVPPHASTHASYLAKRLRRRFPQLKLVAALWTDLDNIERTVGRLKEAGVDDVVTTFADALQRLRDVPLAPAASQSQPRSRTAG
jgi:predicted PurR-regulated permease PerM